MSGDDTWAMSEWRRRKRRRRGERNGNVEDDVESTVWLPQSSLSMRDANVSKAGARRVESNREIEEVVAVFDDCAAIRNVKIFTNRWKRRQRCGCRVLCALASCVY